MHLSSLRVRLLCLVLLAELPAFGLIVHAAVEQRRAATAEAQATALRIARLAATNQARQIAGARELLIALSRLPEIRRRDGAACSRLLARLIADHPIYANLGVIDRRGNLYCSGLPMPGPVDLADRAYFRRAVATRGFAVGDYQIGRVTRVASVNVGYPLLGARGRVEGVVFAAIGLAGLNQVVQAANLPAGSTFTVVDRRGTILVRAPDPERWVGRAAPPSADVAIVRRLGTGVAEAAGPDGVPRLLGFTPLLGGGEAGDVYVSIGIPTQSVVATVNQALGRNVLGLAVVTALAFVAAWAGGQAFVVRRVQALVSAAQRLAAGDLSVRVGGSYRGEMGLLARAFDEMAETLERRTREREQAEQTAARSEKLASLGRLAAGVAHELRNPLTVVTARVGLLRDQVARASLPQPDRLAKQLESLSEAAARMQRIMEGLSAYSKPARPEPAVLDVGALLANVRELVGYPAKRARVDVVVEAPSPAPSVRGDRSQFMQILVNLATNAIEAMAETGGGTLTLRARLAHETGPADDSPLASVVIEVADTGLGIPPETLEKIWEPFFTTKAEGTGLGLSIVRSLVAEQPGASLAVDSAPGRGTTFRLRMPPVHPHPRGDNARTPVAHCPRSP